MQLFYSINIKSDLEDNIATHPGELY